MKKIIISTLMLSSVFAYAKTYGPYAGKPSNSTGGVRTDITVNDKTAEVIFQANTVSEGITNSMFRTNASRTVQRVVVTNDQSESGYGYANIAAGWNIDANSATESTATDDTKYNFISDKLEVVAGTYTFTNSASDTAKVYLKFGELWIDSKTNAQAQTITFKNITADVSTTKTYLGENRWGTNQVAGDSILEIADTAVVDWTGEIRVGKKGSTINKGKLKVDGTLTAKTGVKFFSGTSTISGTLITEGDFYIDGTATVERHNGTFQMKSMNLYGAFYDKSTAPTSQLILTNITSGIKNNETSFWGGEFKQDIATGENTGVRFAGGSNALRYGSAWVINEKITLGGDASKTSTLWIDDLSSINFITSQDQNARIEFLGNATLTLSKENAITNNNDGSPDGWAKLYSTNSISGKTNKLTLQADQTFHSIVAEKPLNIILENDAKLFLVGDCENTIFVEKGQRLNIYNFKEDSIYVGLNYDKYIVENRIVAYTGTDTSTMLDKVYVSSTGWLTALPAVPEPAEWAMIFGAIALGFAIYRRRK